jgi:hypothetical protein
MAKRDLDSWIEARKRFRLSDAHIQMARELGMNPKKFGSLANCDQEPWKAPLPVFIENIYFKTFGKPRPDHVRSVEALRKDREKKKAERKARRRREKEPAQHGELAQSDESGAAPTPDDWDIPF